MGHVFFMGAGVTFREPVPAALEPGSEYRAEPSHNVRCDVEAARIVFESGLPITCLTNDVTTLVWWDGIPVRQLLDARRPPETVAVGRLLDVWLKYRSRLLGRPFAVLVRTMR
jgi:inosine-uridine nucleoside N-ribohydrolase